MLPHEVVTGAGLHGLTRHNPRPHSRQVDPSPSRANGRIGAALRQANAGINGGGLSHTSTPSPGSYGGGGPFISKSQILQDGGMLNLTHPTTIAGRAGSPTRQPGPPSGDQGAARSLIGSKTMPRRIGNAFVNPKTATIGTSVKSTEQSPPRAHSPAAGTTASPSSHGGSPMRAQSPTGRNAGGIGEAYRDQIVRPASRYAAASSAHTPIRSGTAPVSSTTSLLSPQRSSTSKSHSKTTVSQRLGAVPFSRSSVPHGQLIVSSSRNATNDYINTNGHQQNDDVGEFIHSLIHHRELPNVGGWGGVGNSTQDHLQWDEQVLHPFRLATGVTIGDLCGGGGDDEYNHEDEGICIADLVSMECLTADLKSLAMDVTIPHNSIDTLRAPQLTLLHDHFITRPLLGKGHSLPPSKSGSPSSAPLFVHHLVVDLSQWGNNSLAPIVTIPGLFAQRGCIEECGMDRSIEFTVKASNTSMFMLGTPSISCGALGPESGHKRWLEGAGLVMVLNPNVSGSTRLTVTLVDNASIDMETGETLTSSEVYVILLHITKNGVVQGTGTSTTLTAKGAGGGDTSPEKRAGATTKSADATNVAVAGLLPASFLATFGITTPSVVDISLPALSALPPTDAARVIRPKCPISPRGVDSSHSISFGNNTALDGDGITHPFIPVSLPSRCVGLSENHLEAYTTLDKHIPTWENYALHSHTSKHVHPKYSACYLKESTHIKTAGGGACYRSDGWHEEEDGVDCHPPNTSTFSPSVPPPVASCKVEVPPEDDLYAAFDFPKFDAFALRKEDFVQNQLECCEKFYGKRNGGSTSRGSSHTSLPFAQATLPISPSVAPAFLSVLSVYEMLRFPYNREERRALTSASMTQSESPRRGDQEANLRGIVDELFVSTKAATLFDADSSDPTAASSIVYDPIRGHALTEAMLDLAGLHVRLALSDSNNSTSKKAVDTHIHEAVELYEHVARLQGYTIGIHTVDAVGNVQLRLSQQIVDHKKLAMHEEVNECTLRCEEFVETLTTAATFLKHVSRFSEALQLLHAAHKASEHYLGGESTSTLRVMSQIAECYYAQGRLLEALAILKQSIEIAGIIVGSESTTATNLGLLYAVVLGDLGDGVGAVEVARKAVQTRDTDVAVMSNSQLDSDPALVRGKYLLAQSLSVLTLLDAQIYRSATLDNNEPGTISTLGDTVDLIRHIVDITTTSLNHHRRMGDMEQDENLLQQRSLVSDSYMLMLVLARSTVLSGRSNGVALASEAAVGLNKHHTKLESSSNSKTIKDAKHTTSKSDATSSSSSPEIQDIQSDGSADDDDEDEDGTSSLFRLINRVVATTSTSPPAPPSVVSIDVTVALVDVVIQKMMCTSSITHHSVFTALIAACLPLIQTTLGTSSLASIRTQLLLAQLNRFKSWKKSLEYCQDARTALIPVVSTLSPSPQKSVTEASLSLLPSHPDFVACECTLSLSCVASLHSLCGNGRLYAKTLQMAEDAINRSQASLQGIVDMGRIHHSTFASTTATNTISYNSSLKVRSATSGSGIIKDVVAPYLMATDPVSEWVIEPAMMTVHSLSQKMLPPTLSARLLARIQHIIDKHGETSLQLVEPFYLLGVIHYIQDDFTGSHHFLSKSLKCADTINFLFLLGHLFKPAAQLTTSDAAERNRVAKERLQPPQALQFASILFAIASTYTAQGNTEDAQTTFLQSLAALELAQCGHSLATAHTMAALSKLLYDEGHYGDAIAHILKAMALVDEYHISIGEEAVNNTSYISEVGQLYSKADLEEVLRVIRVRLGSKGYMLTRHFDSNHRFMVQM